MPDLGFLLTLDTNIESIPSYDPDEGIELGRGLEGKLGFGISFSRCLEIVTIWFASA
jgi:hypothetical protein